MLPDFPKTKKMIGELLMHYLQRRVLFHMGYMGQIPRIVVPEGRGNRLIRADGTTDDVPMNRISASAEVNADPAYGLDFAQQLRHLDDIAEQLAKQQVRAAIQRVDEVAEEAGNVLHFPGGQLDMKALNDLLETVDVDFDGEGNPIMPSVLCGPEIFKKSVERREEIESDEAEKSRQKAILARKKEEYRARESRRRLVD